MIVAPQQRAEASVVAASDGSQDVAHEHGPPGSASQSYLAATKAEKGRILDGLVARTGYHRKHLVRLLRHGAKGTRTREFDEAVGDALVIAWETTGRMGSRRLRKVLPELVPRLVRHGVLPNDIVVTGKLCAISAATIDRVLAPARGRTPQPSLDNQLETLAHAIGVLAKFTIPPDLSADERVALQAEYCSVVEALQRFVTPSQCLTSMLPSLPHADVTESLAPGSESCCGATRRS